MKYNLRIVIAYFQHCGLPKPELEYKFHPDRKWRFDFAWPDWAMRDGKRIGVIPGSVALEVDGGIWIRGGHNRGAQMKKEWEKFNEAAALGWRVVRCEPKDVCTEETVKLIRRALDLAEFRKVVEG